MFTCTQKNIYKDLCRFDALLSLCRKRCGLKTIGVVLLVEVHEDINRGLKRIRALGLIPGLPVVTLLYWGVRKAAYLTFHVRCNKTE